MSRFQRCRYGIFVHYVAHLAMDADGNPSGGIQETADAFDMESFLEDLSAMRVEYVIFTAWHAMSNPLYPSRVMEEYRPGHSAERDLIGELIQGCRKRGGNGFCVPFQERRIIFLHRLRKFRRMFLLKICVC